MRFGFLGRGDLEKLFKAVGNFKAEYALKMTSARAQLVCSVSRENIERAYPLVSFWKNPIKNIINRKARKGYHHAVEDLQDKLKKGSELEKYLAFTFLSGFKNVGANIPKIFLDEIERFPKNYLKETEKKLFQLSFEG